MNKNSNIKPKSNKKLSLAGKALLLGAIVLVVSLVLSFWSYGFLISFSIIKEMHLKNPALFVLELLPFLLYFVIRNYSRESEQEREYMEQTLEERDAEISEIADFATKIGEGDFSAQIEKTDEDDKLCQSLMMMRNNLVETNRKEKEQNWISKGKDIISDLLRLHHDINDLAYDVIVNTVKYTGVIQGGFYLFNEEKNTLNNIASYAYNRKKYISQEFKVGYGLIGQAAYEMDMVYRTEIPDYYISITSGLLKDKKPGSILIMPLINEEKLQGVIEFAAVEDSIPELTQQFVKEISVIIAQTVFNLKVNARTEQLLSDAQAMTKELKENEEQLRENAEEMQATHQELEKSNDQLEEKIAEVQNAQKRLYSLLENASEVISIYDKDTTILYESPSVKNILGYDATEVIGQKGFTKFKDREKALFNEMFEKLLQNPGESQTLELKYEKTDGTEIWLESFGRNLIDNTAIGGIIFNTRDITQRKIAEQEQRMRGQMQSLSENSPDMIIRIGTSGKVFYSNPVLELYTGISPENANQKLFNDIDFNDGIKTLFSEILEKIVASHTKYNLEAIFEVPEGEKIMQVNAIPEFNENEELETVLIVAHDITERKQIELEIQDKNKKIEDSINYAQRIQKSILPDTKYIQEYLPKSFVFYKPRDVVSGDFPWFFRRDNIIHIAAVDCTGHGVPGALLSFIGYFILNNIVDRETNFSSGEVLDLLHSKVRKTLKQDRAGANARDGMDIALCQIDLSTKTLQYSGAHRPLYLLRNKELIQYKGNPKAIGGIPLGKKKEKDFETHTIDIIEGDKIFFFSDGLPDQIGGPDKRKYQAKRIRQAILDNPEMPVVKFNNYFSKDFVQWKSNYKQIDDVLLIGIEF